MWLIVCDDTFTLSLYRLPVVDDEREYWRVISRIHTNVIENSLLILKIFQKFYEIVLCMFPIANQHIYTNVHTTI